MTSSMFERPATTHIRCPKCRSKDINLVETSSWTTEWAVTDGKFDRAAGYHEPMSVDRLDAKCHKCEYTWKPRGAWQIDDVCIEIEEDEEEAGDDE